MSTRGAWGLRKAQTDKVTYNHSDSYPSWLGKRIYQFIVQTTDEEMEEAFDRIELVEEGRDTPSGEAVRACRALSIVDTGVSEQSEEDWYCALRGAQGRPLFYVRGAHVETRFHSYETGETVERTIDVDDNPLRWMIDGHDFLADSLFCEYAYIINLDTKRLEFYVGSNQDGNATGRYAKEWEPTSQGREPEYRGVRLVWDPLLKTVREMTEEEFVEKAQECEGEPDFSPRETQTKLIET